eukprot:1032098-Alexandrium_andersonii.AAC.1
MHARGCPRAALHARTACALARALARAQHEEGEQSVGCAETVAMHVFEHIEGSASCVRMHPND